MTLPFVVSELVWSAKAATETKELKSDFERCSVAVIEITTAGFSGTIDIQGKLHESNAFSNVPYIRQDQATAQTPSVSQLNLTTDNGIYRYVILGYWRRLQLVMTRTAGTITCGVAGSSDAKVFPFLPVDIAAVEDVNIIAPLPAGTNAIGKLAANSGVDIGDVDVLSEPSGSGVYTTATHTQPSILATTTVALAANANRLYALFINDSNEVIYLKIAAAAVLNQGIRLNASGGSYEMGRKLGNLNTGAVNGICASGSKALLVTEGV